MSETDFIGPPKPARKYVLTNPYGVSCCGYSYSKADKPRKSLKHKGLRIIDGQHFTEVNDSKEQVAHVKTRNGTITVHVIKPYKAD